MEEINSHIEKISNIYSNILNYLENESNKEDEYQNLLKLFQETKITENKYELKELLYIIVNIGNNHLRNQFFLTKILRLLDFLKNPVKNNFSNFEIFSIFKSNKRFLLFFVEEKILEINANIVNIMDSLSTYKKTYLKYFSPEIKNLNISMNKDDINSFEEKRRKAENDCRLCQLIRSDSINDFISYVNSNVFEIDSLIPDSIFETNSILLDKKSSIIDYSAFYGAIKIFKYLIANKASVDKDIWLFAMHGNNPEILHILEDQQIVPNDDADYKKYFYESLKCHHNDFSAYFQDNYMNNIADLDKLEMFSIALKYHNYAFFPTTVKNKFVFYDFCQYDYCLLVDLFLKNIKINVAAKVILNIY